MGSSISGSHRGTAAYMCRYETSETKVPINPVREQSILKASVPSYCKYLSQSIKIALSNSLRQTLINSDILQKRYCFSQQPIPVRYSFYTEVKHLKDPVF